MNEYRSENDWPYHISAGGVVFRKGKNGETEILLAWRNDLGGKTYHLPKGTLHYDETLEACARREVEEESGATAEIVGYLGATTRDYTSPRDGRYIDKTTHYFAMKFQEFSREHDVEHDGVEWFLIDEAREKLAQTEPRKEEFVIVDRLKEFLSKSSA